MIRRAASGKSTQQPARGVYYWIVVTLLFAWAAWQRFVLPLDPIADPDAWGYLAPALRKLVGAEFGHTYGRNFVYPGFLFLLLRVFGDFRAIVITQHLLGLVAGAVLILTWQRARCFVPDSRLSRASHDGLGFVAATIFLLAAEPLRFEMQLRPEGVCAFLVSINLYLAIQFMACAFVEKRSWAAVGYGVGTTFTSILLASAKPSFALMMIVALAPIGVFCFGRERFWQKVALGAGAALAAAGLIVPERLLSRHDEASRTFLPISLFVAHADLIRDQMADDLRSGGEVPYSRDWLEGVHDRLRTEIGKSAKGRPGHFLSLGFDPDYLMFNPSSIVAQLRQDIGDVTEQSTFYWRCYWRIWRERPLLVMRKIVRQMALFYSQMCPAYNREKSLSIASGYDQGTTVLYLGDYPQLWTTYLPAEEFVNRTEVLARSAPIIRQSLPLRMTLSSLAGIYRPLLLGFIVVSAVFLVRRNYRRRLGGLAVLVVFMYAYNAANCLEVAIIHSLEVRRYVTVQMFFALFAEFFALWFLCEIALENRAPAPRGDR